MNKDSNIPKFGDEQKKNPFSVPEGYFDSLPSRIQERCVKPEKEKSWLKALVPQLGFAVGFIILVFFAKGFFGIVGQKSIDSQDLATAIENITDSSLYNASSNETSSVEDAFVDDVIISYLVFNNISDLEIIQ